MTRTRRARRAEELTKRSPDRELPGLGVGNMVQMRRSLGRGARSRRSPGKKTDKKLDSAGVATLAMRCWRGHSQKNAN